MPKTAHINSRREYLIVFFEYNTISAMEEDFKPFYERIQLSDIFEGEWEYRYALQDRIDGILDLQIGYQLVMNFSRDNPRSMGVITRIK